MSFFLYYDMGAILLTVGLPKEEIIYTDMLDEEVVDEAVNGDYQALEYLINKYKNFVKSKARSYFLIGADREDIIQEGMIGLYKAIRDLIPTNCLLLELLLNFALQDR